MKVETQDWAGYRGYIIERLKAQAKKFKEVAEDALGQDIEAIWAVGGVAGDGEFDETSDVELIVEIVNLEEFEDTLAYVLQDNIDLVETDVGFIRIDVQNPEDYDKKLLIID